MNAAEAFEAEMKKQSERKVMSVANLRQEMTDRRGTSVKLIKKELEDNKGQIASRFGDVPFEGKSGELEERDSTKERDSEEKGNEKKERNAGLGSHFSKWDQEESVSALDDLRTVKQESIVSGPSFSGLASNLIGLSPSNLGPSPGIHSGSSLLPGLPSSLQVGSSLRNLSSSTPLPNLSESPEPSGQFGPESSGQFSAFGDMPLCTIQETPRPDDENEQGLLARDDDDCGIFSITGKIRGDRKRGNFKRLSVKMKKLIPSRSSSGNDAFGLLE